MPSHRGERQALCLRRHTGVEGIDAAVPDGVPRWCAHARRLYATVTDRVRLAAALLASRMSRGRLASPFTAREDYRNDWTELTEPAWWGRRSSASGSSAGSGQKRRSPGTVAGQPCGSRSILGLLLAESRSGFVGFVGWSPPHRTARVTTGSSEGGRGTRLSPAGWLDGQSPNGTSFPGIRSFCQGSRHKSAQNHGL